MQIQVHKIKIFDFFLKLMCAYFYTIIKLKTTPKSFVTFVVKIKPN